jgi:hypothetical protein
MACRSFCFLRRKKSIAWPRHRSVSGIPENDHARRKRVAFRQSNQEGCRWRNGHEDFRVVNDGSSKGDSPEGFFIEIRNREIRA